MQIIFSIDSILKIFQPKLLNHKPNNTCRNKEENSCCIEYHPYFSTARIAFLKGAKLFEGMNKSYDGDIEQYDIDNIKLLIYRHS